MSKPRKTNRNNRNNHKTNVAICTACNGSGRTEMKKVSCIACNATGRYVVKRVVKCKCKGENDKCRRCFGTGKFNKHVAVVPCKKCEATGTVYRSSKCKVCGHEGSARFHKRVKATVGTMGEMWPNEK